jgi:hypothetical protein
MGDGRGSETGAVQLKLLNTTTWHEIDNVQSLSLASRIARSVC